jgi:hypothetical protein
MSAVGFRKLVQAGNVHDRRAAAGEKREGHGRRLAEVVRSSSRSSGLFPLVAIRPQRADINNLLEQVKTRNGDGGVKGGELALVQVAKLERWP